MRIDNPHFANSALMCECPTPRDNGGSDFYFGWFRTNEWRAQFFRGPVHFNAMVPALKAWVQAIPINDFRKHRWYHAAFT